MIVSDHPILSDGLRLACCRTTNAEIVCEALNVTQAVQHFSVSEPDVVIVDLQLPLAWRVIRRLRRMCPGMPIVALTTGSKTTGLGNGGSTALIEVSKTSRSQTIVDVAQNAVLERRRRRCRLR
jgi:DNA-binding NarL/FixJ family response regulator